MKPRWLVCLVTLNIVAGLWLEAWGARRSASWVEPLIGVVTLLHLAFHIWRLPVFARTVGGDSGSPSISRMTLVVCLLLATVGELILSAVFKLYVYRESLLPVFVPPGHVLLFLCGLALTRTNPFGLHRWDQCVEASKWWVPLFAAPFILYGIVTGTDALSAILFVLFLAVLRWGPDKSLYAAMFVLALGLELIGTYFGAWRWSNTIVSLEHYGVFKMPNPPIAAGVFYSLLDLLTLGFLALKKSSGDRPRRGA